MATQSPAPAWDAIVAGAGPAGSVAAHVLARAGYRVLLCDAKAGAQPKIGEVLPAAAVATLRALELPAPERSRVHRPIRGNLSSWGSPGLLATDFMAEAGGPGWRLKRDVFDARLRRAALQSGARFKPARIVGLEAGQRAWRVRCSDGTVATATWLVDATGRAAAVARQLGAQRRHDARLVALYRFGRPRPGVEFDRTVIEATACGWWYGAWLPSGIPVAAWHVAPEFARQIRAQPAAWLEAFRQTHHVRSTLLRPAFPGPTHVADAGGARLDRFAGERWLACGDAALCFDPISGRGIQAAIETGRLAGETIVAELARPGAAIPAYARRLERMRDAYLVEHHQLYAAEPRWPAENFWRSRRRFAK